MKSVAYLALIGAVSATQLMGEADHEFIKFIAEHGKSYGTKEEFNYRAALFKETFAAIQEHNSQNGSFTLGLNHLADLSSHERKKLNGLRTSPKTAEQTYKILDTSNLADEVNWVDAGAVTPVKNQGQCGSCWAFSTTGAIEGADFVATGELKSLSEQNLVDCSGSYGNMGCNGGDMDAAFQYVEDFGIMSESDYPYTGTDGECKFDKTKSVGVVTGFDDVKPESPDQLKAALTKGPVSVAIEADKLVFQFYKTGVLNSAKCGTDLDHGVLAVGYGSENGEEYFLVKNSWGPTWGAEGYIKIDASAKNICGILSDPSYPEDN